MGKSPKKNTKEPIKRKKEYFLFIYLKAFYPPTATPAPQNDQPPHHLTAPLTHSRPPFPINCPPPTFKPALRTCFFMEKIAQHDTDLHEQDGENQRTAHQYF